MEITGQRIVLRPLVLTDAPLVVSAINESVAELRPFLPWVKTSVTLAEEQAFLEKCVLEMQLNQSFTFGMFQRGDAATLIGIIGTHRIEWDHASTALGYWTATPFAKHGYMTEACVLILEALFQELKLHRVEIRVAPENAPSNRVVEKLGLRKEGVLKSAGALAGNRWSDLNLYAMLVEEYQSVRKSFFESYLGGTYPKIRLG
jgi:ribosomal-protein-serine acetyltransferase